MKQLKGLVYDFVDNGKILNKPRGITKRYDLDDRKIKFLQGFLDLILNNDKFITKESKYYISNKYITIAGVAEALKCKSEKTVRTKVWRDKNKIAYIFGDKFITDILYYKDAGMDFYEEKLDEVRFKYTDVKLLSNIDLNLPQGVMQTTVEDNTFADFIGIILLYLKTQKRAIEQEISPDIIGYIKWLFSSNFGLTQQDIERKERLSLLLGGEEYSSL